MIITMSTFDQEKTQYTSCFLLVISFSVYQILYKIHHAKSIQNNLSKTISNTTREVSRFIRFVSAHPIAFYQCSYYLFYKQYYCFYMKMIIYKNEEVQNFLLSLLMWIFQTSPAALLELLPYP